MYMLINSVFDSVATACVDIFSILHFTSMENQVFLVSHTYVPYA